jgi:hypothetical protein
MRGAWAVAIEVSFVSPGSADAGWAAAAGQDLQHRWVANLRADGAFQGGVDAGEQPSDAVGQPGGLAGQVVVEPDQHVQLG